MQCIICALYGMNTATLHVNKGQQYWWHSYSLRIQHTKSLRNITSKLWPYLHSLTTQIQFLLVLYFSTFNKTAITYRYTHRQSKQIKEIDSCRSFILPELFMATAKQTSDWTLVTFDRSKQENPDHLYKFVCYSWSFCMLELWQSILLLTATGNFLFSPLEIFFPALFEYGSLASNLCVECRQNVYNDTHSFEENDNTKFIRITYMARNRAPAR